MKLLRFWALFAVVVPVLWAREFTVMVYNVENLFDADGIAVYDDYQAPPEGAYSVEHVLNKLESIRRVVTGLPESELPEVILFQEFELDRTPYGTPSADTFLADHRGVELRTLLETERWARKLPAELLLLKYLDDHGISGYHVALPDPARKEQIPAINNVVFSRFPVRYVRQYPKSEARDLLEVGLDVDGELLIVLNNHWKSGASNPELERVRVQNALVVRTRLEGILLENPLADVIIAGDLNSYYNHSAVFPELPETGVNHILRSTGREASLQAERAGVLYNLWFELPREERGSEVWRGKWGTLMQMLLTPGLYDQRGIQYVDNSFNRLIIPGENADSRWQRPRRWTHYGTGGGYSDHLPIYARFRVVSDPQDGWMPLENPSDADADGFQPELDFSRINRVAVPPAEFLEHMTPRERALQIGEVFAIDARVHSRDPVTIRYGELILPLFSHIPELRSILNRLQVNDRIRGIADLDAFRGELQLVFRHESWLDTRL